mmetsp:Transcript_123110/g.347902  ORF Transcript_123110/g.347902 Transcript_123110/m.347902 type:complete len:352 (+) Transcript_123110:1-1056(+)
MVPSAQESRQNSVSNDCGADHCTEAMLTPPRALTVKGGSRHGSMASSVRPSVDANGKVVLLAPQAAGVPCRSSSACAQDLQIHGSSPCGGSVVLAVPECVTHDDICQESGSFSGAAEEDEEQRDAENAPLEPKSPHDEATAALGSTSQDVPEGGEDLAAPDTKIPSWDDGVHGRRGSSERRVTPVPDQFRLERRPTPIASERPLSTVELMGKERPETTRGRWPKLATAERASRPKAHCEARPTARRHKRAMPLRRLNVISCADGPFSKRSLSACREACVGISGECYAHASRGISCASGHKAKLEMHFWGWEHADLRDHGKLGVSLQIPPLPNLLGDKRVDTGVTMAGATKP